MPWETDYVISYSPVQALEGNFWHRSLSLGCRQPLGSEEEALRQHVGCGVQTGSAD